MIGCKISSKLTLELGMIEPPNEFVKEFIPIAGKFFEAVKNGVQEYHQKDPNDIIEHRPTTQKSVIRDKIVANITRLMPEISGMKLIKRYGTDVFVLFGKYKLKVHMLVACRNYFGKY